MNVIGRDDSMRLSQLPDRQTATIRTEKAGAKMKFDTIFPSTGTAAVNGVKTTRPHHAIAAASATARAQREIP